MPTLKCPSCGRPWDFPVESIVMAPLCPECAARWLRPRHPWRTLLLAGTASRAVALALWLLARKPVQTRHTRSEVNWYSARTGAPVIEFHCPQYEYPYRLPDQRGGKHIVCSECGHTLRVPHAPPRPTRARWAAALTVAALGAAVAVWRWLGG